MSQKKGKKDIFATSISVSLFRTATKVRKMCENCAKKNHMKYSVVCMHGHAWTCKVATAHTHGRFFPFTYIHTYKCYACVCACAHLHTCAFTVVKTWINGRPSSRAAQRSNAAHFSTLCCQMPPSHTHTRAYGCAACRTGCSRNVTQKKNSAVSVTDCSPGRGAAHS